MNLCIFDVYRGKNYTMNKLLIFVFVALLTSSYAQVNQNSSSPAKEDLKEAPSTTAPQTKKESSTQDKQYRSSENEVQQIESAVSTYSISRSSAKQSRTSRTPSTYNQGQMDNAVDVLEKAAPNSYEFHLFTYLAGNYDISLIDHLNKAEKLQGNTVEVLSQKAAYHLIKNEDSKALSYLQRLVDGKKISKDVLNYGEDLLRSVPQNGILITHGFDDSYSTHYMQLKKSIRKDVTIISLDFLQSSQFRSVVKNGGLKLPERTTIDVEFLKQFVEMNEKMNLTIATTVPKEYLTGISSKLFVTGLVFTYSTEINFDNYTRNKELWNEDLKKTLISNADSDKGKQLAANYLPMLLQLANSGDKLKQDVSDLNAVIDKVAKMCSKTEQVNKLKSY